MLRVVFMGTPDFAVPSLDALNQTHQIVGVYTQTDKPVGRGLDLRFSPVKKRALELHLPVFQPEKLTAPGEFEKLQALSPDVIVVVAFGKILRKNVLDLPRLGCINVHSSLLPRWRGAAPIQHALLAGDQKTGVTTMHLVEQLDAGDILLQKSTLISRDDTASSVHDRLALLGADLIKETLVGLEKGSLVGQSQNESEVTFAEKLDKDMEWLNPNTHSAEELDRQVRALNPWPGTSLWMGQRLKVKQTNVHPHLSEAPGRLCERSGMLILGTQRGSLELLRIQWEGKKEIGPSEFINGMRGKGEALPLFVAAHPQS